MLNQSSARFLLQIQGGSRTKQLNVELGANSKRSARLEQNIFILQAWECPCYICLEIYSILFCNCMCNYHRAILYVTCITGTFKPEEMQRPLRLFHMLHWTNAFGNGLDWTDSIILKTKQNTDRQKQNLKSKCRKKVMFLWPVPSV